MTQSNMTDRFQPVGDYRVRHWFNGLALLHAFCFRDGQVSYVNRYVRSTAYRHAVEKEQLYGKQFAPDPCASLFGRYFAEYAPNLADNAAISVTRIADRFVALSDAALPMEFDPRTLQTRGVFEYANSTPLGICTPHPHRDLDHGGLYNYGTIMGEQSAYRVFVVPDGSTAQEVVATIPRPEPCYMHSFAMTSNDTATRYAAMCCRCRPGHRYRPRGALVRADRSAPDQLPAAQHQGLPVRVRAEPGTGRPHPEPVDQGGRGQWRGRVLV